MYQLNGFTVDADEVACARLGIGEIAIGIWTDERSTATFDIDNGVTSLRFGIEDQISWAVLSPSSPIHVINNYSG